MVRVVAMGPSVAEAAAHDPNLPLRCLPQALYTGGGACPQLARVVGCSPRLEGQIF
jgi:hypothetical protein